MASTRRPRARTVIAGVAAVAVLAAAAVGVHAVLARHDDNGTNRPAHVSARTTPIVRRTLANTVSATGSIRFRDPRPLPGVGTGVITELPEVGTTTRQGATLYRVDDQPVVAFYGSTPFFRAIDRIGLTGADVDVLARNLHALGYFDGYLPEDPHEMVFTRGLRAALRAWQRDIGAHPSGSLLPGQALVLPGRLRIGAVRAALGDPAAEPVATLTKTGKIISGRGPAGMTNGPARLSLPDGRTVVARVTVSDSADGQPTFTARPVTHSALAHVSHGSVTVTVTTEIHRNVLAVPIVALLALQGGSQYALERPDGRLVAVHTGMFTSDMVEISGAGLQAGQPVVSAS